MRNGGASDSSAAASVASGASGIPDARRVLAEVVPALLLDRLADLGADIQVLATLRAIHGTLWGLEDRARSRQASTDTIASVKRAIDHCNGRRHQLIDAFDASLVVHPSPAAGARRYSETPGELLDRLVILSLKRASARRLSRSADLPPARRAQCRDKADRLARWTTHLHECLARLLADLQTGQAALPPRAEFKMYNDPLLNDVTRAELLQAGPGGSGRRHR